MKRTELRRKSWWNPKRKPMKRRKPLAKVNPKRRAKRLKSYRQRLAKADWQQIRRKVWERDQGLCQCPEHVEARKDGEAWAFEPIDIWFDLKGEIHGFDTHHTTYARFGREELSDLLTMAPKCHRRYEAKHGLRRAFLSGK